ncbi:MAG: hypothetical protein NW223_15750 [Hyphomicrobiaceae bacterium]|nr:hypothetical protein [Hyphomicrobiaceae bacterium]
MAAFEAVDLAGTDHQIARWIWRNLVPEAGQAQFLQAELLRAVEKLRWEAQENGNINWDDGFEMLIDLLSQHLLGEARFSRSERVAIEDDLKRLRTFLPVRELKDDADAGSLPYVRDDLYDRLTSSVVRFCRLNPTLIPYRHDPEQYR